MKRLLPIVLLAVFSFFSNTILADDILIPFGQNLASPPTWKYKGGGTNLDAVLWKDLAYGEPGWVTGGSAFGFGGGPVRNTSIPENATAGGGGVSGARYPTMYFRTTINIPSLAAYGSFQLRTKFDDAIVVWINGTQAYINNIASGAAYATLATGAIANNGADIYTTTLNSSLFVTGNNIIAVEIHQSALTSSDLFFDLELTGIAAPPANTVIFPFGQNLAGAPAWKYKGGGTNLDAIAWKDLAYAEPGWVTGNSALGFGTNPPVRNTAIPENTSVGGGGASGARYPTMYFRKTVNIPDLSVYAGFQISSKFDDGIVIWVNGVEAYRNNINANPAYADLAPAAIANNGADVYTTVLGVSKFVTGNNIIAVEIHQNSLTSSDLFFDMELTGLAAVTPTILRGPYLQMGKQTGINIRWRTDLPTNSRVTLGTVFGTYTNTFDDAADTTEHEVIITGLNPDTKYYYTVGSSTAVYEATVNNFFRTLPLPTTSRKIKVLAFGDCGNNSTNQADVRDAFLSYATTNSIETDAWILLGDNGYNAGLDAEYTAGFFNVYKSSLLKNIKLYPAPGNHDYSNDATNQGLRTLPYYNTFSMPQNAEIGGVASNTKAYYSYDIGDIHFLALDSYGRENGNTTRLYDTAVGNRQADWLRNDLAANTKRWTVAYFHHPPYTKTSHDSDIEPELIAVRERLLKILERYGVDLVVCGHSHGYERSYLLKGFYNTVASPLSDADFNAAAHTGTGNTQNAKYDATANSCPYTYNSGQYAHGTMYIVAGSAGQIGGSSTGYPENCMYYSNNTNGGSFYFEVDSNRLDAKFISYTGSGGTVAPLVRDGFTIFKDVNKIQNLTVAKNVPLTLTASWRGTYNWPSNGAATTQSVTINNASTGSFIYTVRDANTCLQDVFNVTVTLPLPVSVISFDATLKKDMVSLVWATEREINNKFFSIERSTDGNNYSLLENVDGAGTSSIQQKYHLNDLHPAEGINYYRLSQTDIDGVRQNIEVKKIRYKGTKNFKVTIINAGQGKINLAIHNTGGGLLQMKVIDMMGREILTRSVNSGNADVSQDLQLQKGTYVLKLVNSSGETISNKIIAD